VNAESLDASIAVVTNLLAKKDKEPPEPRLFGENVAVKEQLETQTAMQEAEVQNQEQLAMAAEQGR